MKLKVKNLSVKRYVELTDLPDYLGDLVMGLCDEPFTTDEQTNPERFFVGAQGCTEYLNKYGDKLSNHEKLAIVQLRGVLVENDCTIWLNP